MATWICLLPATWNGIQPHNKDCGGYFHTYCPPAQYPATTNILYHNNGNGTFTDVSKASGIAAKKSRSLGVAFNDYDGDGYADIMVANDAMQEFLFHNNRNGTFTEVGLDAGVGFTDNGSPVLAWASTSATTTTMVCRMW